MNVATESKVSNSKTEYRLVGELAGVLTAVQALFREYDPRGYGTRVSSISHLDGEMYSAQVVRANSCD